MIWEDCYASSLVAMGFRRGIANPCCFRHPDRDMSVVVHGDDFTALGCRDDLEWYAKQLSDHFEIVVKGYLGESDDCSKEVRVLNRIVRIDSEGISYESDPRHVEIIARGLGLEKASNATAPGRRDEEVNYEAILDAATDLELDAVDPDDAEIVASFVPVKKPRRPNLYVTFDDDNLITTINLDKQKFVYGLPYSDMLHLHPRLLVATRRGHWKTVKSGSDPYTGKSQNVMRARHQRYHDEERISRAKRERLDKPNSYLRHGAMWERQPPPEFSAVQSINSITDQHEREKLLRKIMYDLPYEPVFSVRTPPAKGKNQKRRGGKRGQKSRNGSG